MSAASTATASSTAIGPTERWKAPTAWRSLRNGRNSAGPTSRSCAASCASRSSSTAAIFTSRRRPGPTALSITRLAGSRRRKMTGDRPPRTSLEPQDTGLVSDSRWWSDAFAIGLVLRQGHMCRGGDVDRGQRGCTADNDFTAARNVKINAELAGLLRRRGNQTGHLNNRQLVRQHEDGGKWELDAFAQPVVPFAVPPVPQIFFP